MPLIRSAGLRGFRAAVAELGGDAERYATAVGLPLGALDGDDLLVPDRALSGVLELAAADLNCPDLGLRVARRQDLSMLGPLALAIQNSPTVADALACTSRYLFVHAQSLSVSFEDDPRGSKGIGALRYGVAEGVPAPVQGTDLGLGFLHRGIRSLIGGSYGLLGVELPYVPPAPLAVYEKFFDAAVEVGGTAARLRLPRTLFRHPLDGADPHLRQLAMAFMLRQVPAGRSDMASRVRTTVAQALGTATLDIAAVSRLMTVHPRTLQRQLASEGTTFGSIVDDCRRVAARRYLIATDLPLGQVASLVGLSEQSALTRCCKRWWGCTPSAVRRDGSNATASRAAIARSVDNNC